jgi:hypothetical protein
MDHWKTTEPPTDGTPIVAIGRVTVTTENGINTEGFCSFMRWDNRRMAWLFTEDLMSRVWMVEDRVKIDHWTNVPEGYRP